MWEIILGAVLCILLIMLCARQNSTQYIGNQRSMFLYLFASYMVAITLACVYYLLQQLAVYNGRDGIITKYMCMLCGLVLCVLFANRLDAHRCNRAYHCNISLITKYTCPGLYISIIISPLVMVVATLIRGYIWHVSAKNTIIDIMWLLVLSVGSYRIMPIISGIAVGMDCATYIYVYTLIYMAVVVVFSLAQPLIGGAKNNTAN